MIFAFGTKAYFIKNYSLFSKKIRTPINNFLFFHQKYLLFKKNILSFVKKNIK